MTIKDILTITGGNTKVMIFSADKEGRIKSEGQPTCFMTHWCLAQKGGLYIYDNIN